MYGSSNNVDDHTVYDVHQLQGNNRVNSASRTDNYLDQTSEIYQLFNQWSSKVEMESNKNTKV